MKMSKAELKTFRRAQAEAARAARIVEMPATPETLKWADGIGRHKSVSCMVKASGTVLVYDDIAGYYTTVHSLPEAYQQRARELASKQA